MKIAGSADDMAYSAGFSGDRMVSTWTKRLEILEGLGFIKLARATGSKITHALIMDPFAVVAALNKKGLVAHGDWNSLVQRSIEIGAKDLDQISEK